MCVYVYVYVYVCVVFPLGVTCGPAGEVRSMPPANSVGEGLGKKSDWIILPGRDYFYVGTTRCLSCQSKLSHYYSATTCMRILAQCLPSFHDICVDRGPKFKVRNSQGAGQ